MARLASLANMCQTLDFANCDHQASAHAIAKGLATRKEPSYWIHTSGTLLLGYESIDKECYGEELPKVFDDWDGVEDLVNMPDRAAHRPVDKIVLGAASPLVHTAIVCPPTIYGPGRGPDNQRSVQAYEAARIMLEQKRGFLPGKGENVWHEVHVQDLSDLYLLLGEAAVDGGGKATWTGKDGYYLAENGGFKWGDILQSLATVAHKQGLLPSDECPSLGKDELDKLRRFGHLIWGTNSRGKAIRGTKLLGWKPYRPSLMEELKQIVVEESKALGLVERRPAKTVHDLSTATSS